MKRSMCFVLSFLGLALMIIIAGCGGGGYSPPVITPPPVITVSVSASAGSVQAGGTVQVTATLTNDSANKGVTWTVSCSPAPCGTVSPSTTVSGVPTTYTAPATPPPSDVTVTITATSVADPTKLAPVNIDFAAIAVSLSANPSSVGATGISTITAMVSNDPANKGVDPASWAITSPASGGGMLSNPTSTSVTYTAPPTPPPSDVQVTISAKSLSDPTKTGSVGITFVAIVVSLSANPSSVEATGISTITATVSFDPANAGVNPSSWTISPATGAGTLSNPTSTSVTYTAPPTPPPSDVQVTISAKSASDPTKSGSTTVNVLAITVSVSPGSALIPVNITQQFTGSVNNDPTNKGVTWTVMQGATLCPTACGTFAPTSTAIGAPTTYTAPATVPANDTVMPTATSVSDPTKSGSARIKLTAGSVKLVPNSLDFGTLRVSFTSLKTVTLTNTGSTALSISSITITSSGPFSQINTCGTSVGAGMSCTISVTFKPTTRGSFSANLSISDSSADSPQLVSLSGAGFKFRFAAVKSALVTNKTAAVPSPTGRSKVGTRVIDMVDSTRDDPFLANGTKRELLVRFWYPTSPRQACQRAEYSSPKVWSHFSELLGIPLPEVTTNSCWDTSMTNGTHPVVVFTHGYTGTFTDYTFLFEDLASRGYVVASVDHTFEATAVEFPDGRFAESVVGSYLANDARSDEQTFEFAISVRLNDLKFVVNELERLNAGADPQLAGKLDIANVAVAGHSLGGLTAILGVERDSRFKAGILLDGVMPDSLFSGTETPVLLFAPGRDEWRNDERRLWGNLRGPRLAVNLRGSEHMTLSDAVWLANGAIKTGAMGPEKTIAAVRNYIAAFLDANLRGKPVDPLLTGPTSDYPDAAVTTQKQLLRGEN